MNKKYIAFGLMGVFLMVFATAQLVDYLSNKAEVSVTVESPVLLEISTDGDVWLSNPATLAFDSVYGGEGITFWVRDTNLANVAITGGSSKLVFNDDGITCGDFESVTANGNDLLTYCDVVNSKTVKFDTYTAGGLDAGEVDTNEIKMAFKQNALGTYVFTMQKMSA